MIDDRRFVRKAMYFTFSKIRLLRYVYVVRYVTLRYVPLPDSFIFPRRIISLLSSTYHTFSFLLFPRLTIVRDRLKGNITQHSGRANFHRNPSENCAFTREKRIDGTEIINAVLVYSVRWKRLDFRALVNKLLG